MSERNIAMHRSISNNLANIFPAADQDNVIISLITSTKILPNFESVEAGSFELKSNLKYVHSCDCVSRMWLQNTF